MDYGRKIKYVREKIRDISLTELHKRTGLSLSYLSDTENGKCNMSIRALEKVAKALGVDSAYLLDNDIMSLRKLTEMNNVDIPDDVIEFFAKQESLPYALLAKDLYNEDIDPIFFRELLESIKKMKSK